MINNRFSGEPSSSSSSPPSSSLTRDFQSLSVSSKRLVRTVSHKLRKKSHPHHHPYPYQPPEDDQPAARVRVSTIRCLSLYARAAGGCKVGADDTTTTHLGDSTATTRRSMSTIASSHEWRRCSSAMCEFSSSGVDCFPHGVKDKLWKRTTSTTDTKDMDFHETIRPQQLFLPDDILEMCLLRLPLTSLMNARLVCKRWRYLTTTPRFMQMRRQGLHQSPWLFLFGAVKDGYCSGEIQVLDASLRQWHKVDSEFLKGRFLFSVTSVWDDIYIVGGCSSLTNFGKLDRSSFKTHKGVFVFSPLTKSSRKVASMKFARSAPILGICEVSSDYKIAGNQQSRQDRRFYRSRTGGVSDVYEDPHRLSLRRQQGNSTLQYDPTLLNSRNRNSLKFVKQKNDQLNTRDSRRFVMIAVGGVGPWDEPLYSGELYDSVSNKWVEIQRLPVDFGTVCSGVVCNKMFYVCSETDRLAAYDIEKGLWIGIQTTPFPSRVHEYHPKLVVSNDRLFMLSVSWCEGDGEIGRRNKAVRKLWELDLVFMTWNEVSIHPDAPMDWNAAFVADRNLIFGVEMFKIFGQVLDFFTVCDVSDVGINWTHIAKNQVARELDASSCVTKTLAVVHL